MTAGARFVYSMPNFQNPTGRRMPLARVLHGDSVRQQQRA